MTTQMLVVSVALILSAPPGVVVRGQDDSLAGKWVANLEKSSRDVNHQFESATLEFVVNGNTVLLTHGGVNASGQQESATVVLVQADGEEHPVPGQAGIGVRARWASPRRLEIVSVQDGATVGESAYEVSPDGRTLTASVSATDASGRHFEQVIVFDRE